MPQEFASERRCADLLVFKSGRMKKGGPIGPPRSRACHTGIYFFGAFASSAAADFDAFLELLVSRSEED